MKRAVILTTLAVFLALTPATGQAADASGELMQILEGLKTQMADMQRKIDSQSARIQELESMRVASAGTQISAQAPQLTDADWQKGIKDNLGEAISWLKGAKYGGDFRLRMENFNFFDKIGDRGSNTSDRNRFRYRLRWGFEKDYGDDWKVGFRLASGDTSNQTSTNETMGDDFTFDSIVIDRAYAKYTPNGLKDLGPIQEVTIGAGKFENPFLKYATPIVWDGDVTPEGAYEQVQFKIYGDENNKVNLMASLGQFLISESSSQNSDTEMFGFQGGLVWSTYNFGTEMPVDFSLGASYYLYDAYDARSTYSTYLRTNTRALEDPKVVDLLPSVTFYLGDRVPVNLWYNYVKNYGDLNANGLTSHEAHFDDDAFGLGLKVGKLKNPGDWEAFYGYYQIGANAVPAAFSDSDFGGPSSEGFTNRKGHKFGLGYQLTKSVQVNWTGYVVDVYEPISNAQAGGHSAYGANEKVFRSQADVVFKF